MDKNNIKKEYTNGEITIVWESGKCIHSTRCWNDKMGLNSVFNPKERPWIKPEGAPSDIIMAHIKNCPSGALSYYKNNATDKNPEVTVEQIVEVADNGPLLVYGNIVVKDKEGKEAKKSNVTAFCRCGQSNNKPYCDGTHVKIGFKG
jgi:uncharacterized Fe-S cluster protein YjdI